jgi:hypothetical protein
VDKLIIRDLPVDFSIDALLAQPDFYIYQVVFHPDRTLELYDTTEHFEEIDEKLFDVLGQVRWEYTHSSGTVENGDERGLFKRVLSYFRGE